MSAGSKQKANHKIVAVRENTHGDWFENSAYADELIKIFLASQNWHRLPPHKRMALLMIAVKIGRILAGDPEFDDHWEDIGGYSHLGSRKRI